MPRCYLAMMIGIGIFSMKNKQYRRLFSWRKGLSNWVAALSARLPYERMADGTAGSIYPPEPEKPGLPSDCL
ncbi:MAG: hypothetical protein ACLSD6_03715 [Clostridium sp.]